MGIRGPTVSWARQMKGGHDPSPLAGLSFCGSIKVPIYCWVDREFSICRMAKPLFDLTTFQLHSAQFQVTPITQLWFFSTVKILKFGTPQTIAIIVLKLVKFDVTLH